MSVLNNNQHTRFKDSEAVYKQLRTKVDRGTSSVSEQIAYIDAKNAFFSVCEKILSELLSETQ